MHAVARTVKERKKGSAPGEDELGQMDVGGGFDTDEEAGYLALIFNSGALPCPLVVRSSGIAAP